jgi:putative DNA primase/helicase
MKNDGASSTSESYFWSAIEGEASIVANAVASTRNHVLNRAAFKLGSIPDMPTDTAIGALMRASGENGYVNEHGQPATLKVIESGFRNGQRNPRTLTPNRETNRRQPIAQNRVPTARQVQVVASADPVLFPIATPPDEQGKPAFIKWGKNGPPVRSDEKRRHLFVRDGEPVQIKVMHKNGGAANWYRVQNGEGVVGWQARKPQGFVEVPYVGGADPFDREVIADEIYWPEGEKDVDTLNRIGLLATTFGGTGDGLPEGCAAYFAERNVVVLADNDEGGRQHAERKAALIAATAASIRILHFPELAEKGDVSDWVAGGHSADELRERADAVSVWLPIETPTAAGTPTAGRHLISHRASDIQPERLEWVWPGRIARGKVALLGGPPGLGKSQVTANIAAIVSSGGEWPCGEGRAPQGGVLILSAEDGIADTIVPRLIAAAADVEQIRIVAAATRPDGTGRRTFSLKTDVDLLERLVEETGSVRLIIIDPISAYMGGADGNGNVETREVLEPLAEMANRLGIAVVAVTHLNKGGAGNQSALNRFAGSIAFVAAARSAYLIIEDPQDENRRLFLQAKNNLGPKGKGLAFRVEQRLISSDIVASNISWDTNHVTASVDEALSASENRGNNEGRTGKDEAADFLSGLLTTDGTPVLEIEREAREAGLLGPDSPISQNKSFRSAREALGVVPRRKGGAGANGQWVWALPVTPKMPSKPYDAPFLEEGTLDTPGHLSSGDAAA